jgi:hypothetical protein
MQAGRHRNVTLNEHESLTAVFVRADRYGCPVEGGCVQRPQEPMDRGRVSIRGPEDMRASPSDRAGIGDTTGQLDFLHLTSLPVSRGLPPV